MRSSRELTEDEKLRIADLYQNTRISISAIAQFLGYSCSTVAKYKNYKQ